MFVCFNVMNAKDDATIRPPEHTCMNHSGTVPKKRGSTLDGVDEVIEGLDGLGTGGKDLLLGLEASLEVDVLDGLEEGIGLLLLGGGGGEGTDGSAGLVHVSGELVTDVEPLLALGVLGDLLEAVAGLGEDGLLAVEVLVAAGLVRGVEGVRTDLSVDGVRGVGLAGLIGTVGGTLGIGGAVTDDAEDGELGRLTGGGVGDGGDDGGTSGGDAGESITAAGLLLF